MKQKNFVIEVLDDGAKRVFIVRELSKIPNVPPIARVASPDVADIVDLLNSPGLFGSNEES